MKRIHTGHVLAALCFASCAKPAEYKPYLPDYMSTDAGQSRMWLACSPDGVSDWHRVQRMATPGSVKGAIDDSTCVVLRWEIER